MTLRSRPRAATIPAWAFAQSPWARPCWPSCSPTTCCAIAVKSGNSAAEYADQLKMRRPGKLVDRRDLPQLKARIEQKAGITGEARRVAGNANNAIELRAGNLLDLLLRPGARRIEDDSIELVQFDSAQWLPRQVAPLAGDAPARSPRRSRQRGQRAGMPFNGVDPPAWRK